MVQNNNGDVLGVDGEKIIGGQTIECAEARAVLRVIYDLYEGDWVG